MKATKTGIPQGLPVSPILFAIYISSIFQEVEDNSQGVSLSFIDNL
jgi:retron-type reverse transcriptase